jgi:SAM-dependent methyltransferase
LQTANSQIGFDRMAQFEGFFVGFWGTWVLHLGSELGFFRALQEAPLSLCDLAERLGFEKGYVGVWCRAASAYEILDQDAEGRYSLASGVVEALELGGAWAGALVQVSNRVCETLVAVFRGTAPPESRFSLHQQMARVLRSSYQDLLLHQLPEIPEVQAVLTSGGRLLEIGCGCGHGLEILRRFYPLIEPTGLEADYECAREAERSTRAVIVVGTAEECRYESRFDIALFHRSLSYCESPEKSLGRAVAALKPGGFLVVTLPDDFPTTEAELRTDRGRARMGERLFYGMFLAPDPRYNPTRRQVAEWLKELEVEEVGQSRPEHVRNFTLVYRRCPS